MPSKPIVFSDIDYTIVFDSELDPKTEDLLDQVRGHAYFILVTARSKRECAPLPPIPNDGLIAENGATVYVRNGSADELDREWDAIMSRRQDVLLSFQEELRRRGWRINEKLHAFSSCIEASERSEADVEWVGANLPEGLQLHFSRNTAGRYVEVFPLEAGKDKVVFRVCERLGVPVEHTFGLGDNTNDMPMLQVVNTPLAPGNCHPDVRELIQRRGGYVSELEGHLGAQDVLRRVLDAVGG